MSGWFLILIALGFLILRGYMSYAKSMRDKKGAMFIDGLIMFPLFTFWGISLVRSDMKTPLPWIVRLGIIPICIVIAWFILSFSARAGERKGKLTRD